MASILFLEPGTDATGDLAFWSGATTNCSSDTGQAHTGSRSVKLFTNSPAVDVDLQSQVTGALPDTARVSFWFRTDTLPAAINAILEGRQAASFSVWRIRLNPSGNITILPVGATELVGTAVVAVNTWNRICLAYQITNTTTFRFDLWVNGVYQGSTTAGTMTRTGSDRIRLRNVGSGAGANISYWYDDIYTDDGGATFTDPGDVRVTAKRPAANNTNNFDTAIGANPANRWTNVNEVPISTTNGWEQLAASATQENYTLEAAAVGDVDLTAMQLLGRTAWIWAKGAVGGLGTPKIMDNGTETAVVLTAVAKLFTVTTTSSSYPSNAAGIGMLASALDPTFLYECGTIIAYAPNVPIKEQYYRRHRMP